MNAQYNPKELTVDKQIPWSQHQKGNTDGLQWEFTGSQGRTLSLDLLFDGVEENASVADTLKILEKLAAVRDPTSTVPEMRRPHHCVAVWGTVLNDQLASPRFQCVIMQVTIKYTMFSTDGNPLRATITLKLQEATRVSMAEGDTSGAGGGSDPSQTGTTSDDDDDDEDD
ncbi:MAG TPA: hypothetical protein VGG74_12390 [Kofleriaceae bacterium]